MPALYLTEADVETLVDMPLALAALEDMFAAFARGEAENIPRARSKAPGIVLHSMSAAAGYLGVVGWKNYTTTRSGAKFLVGLHAAESGELIALIEADRLGQFRTGAATGIAIRHLAPQAAASVGSFGAGWQAETQLLAACHAHPIREAVVYSRTPERRAEFAARMESKVSAELGRAIRVRPTSEPAEAAAMPIVITATTSREPVFAADAVSPEALVCAAGSNWPNRAEVPAEVISRATAVVCDQIAACKVEAGELIQAAAAGQFEWAAAIELADVVVGKTPVPQSGVRVFKSVGLAIEDVALGFQLLRLARERGVGRLLPF
jgi:alanine dehydrogenase